MLIRYSTFSHFSLTCIRFISDLNLILVIFEKMLIRDYYKIENSFALKGYVKSQRATYY